MNTHPIDPAMWSHPCPVEGPIQMEKGKPCNWCDAVEVHPIDPAAPGLEVMTPRPWRQRFSDVEGRRFPQTVIEDAHGTPVAQVYWHPEQRDWTQTAERIVQCVNAHDDLVAELRNVIAQAEANPFLAVGMLLEHHSNIRAVLEKATGEAA